MTISYPRVVGTLCDVIDGASTLSDRTARFVSSLPPMLVLALVLLPFALSNPLLYRVGFVVLCIVGAMLVCAAALLLFALYAAIGAGLSVLAYRYCRGDRPHYPRTPAGWESVGPSDCGPTYPSAIPLPVCNLLPAPTEEEIAEARGIVWDDTSPVDPEWVAEFERFVAGEESPTATCALPSVDLAPVAPLAPVSLSDHAAYASGSLPGDYDPADDSPAVPEASYGPDPQGDKHTPLYVARPKKDSRPGRSGFSYALYAGQIIPSGGFLARKVGRKYVRVD